MKVRFTLNGRPCTWEVQPDETLLDALREHGVTSVKRGCEEGVCGACTVLVDGKRLNSCLLLAGQIQDRSVLTVEGLGTVQSPHPIQEAFVKAGAVQCGYCTPGMVLATKALLDEKPDPSDRDIKTALDGNLCRCTGYVKILDAVKLAAQLIRTSDERDEQDGGVA